MESVEIRGRRAGPRERPWVVAEIGSNHNGDMELCRRLVDAARECGVDAVKFQSWSRDSLICRAEYERNTRYCGTGSLTLEQQVERYQLGREQHREIAAYCRQREVAFFSSCFSRQEVDLLESLDVPAYKIASMDVNHLPLLRYVAGTHKPVILSTGLATLGEIERALDTLGENGCPGIVLLHCVSLYPSPPEAVNLRNIRTLEACFDVPTGYSDHSLGNAVPLAAVALGACMIEKHFTLDTAMEGWDHGISADPEQMKALVEGCRSVWAALGSPLRRLTGAQLEKRKAFRRRMVAARALPRGAELTECDVEFKRPGTGIRPDELGYALNRRLACDLEPDEEIEWKHLG